MNRKPRVLITYIESGMGHIMSARAIADSLKEKYGSELEIVESNIMKDDDDELLINFEKFLSNQVKMTNRIKGYGPFMFGLLEVLGRQRFNEFVHKTVFRKATLATVEAYRRRRPDVIISTHYFLTLAANELKRRYMPEVTVITYNPDNNVHVWWDNRSEVFITNNDNATHEAVKKRKFKLTSIRQVPFTVRDDVLNAHGTKSEYREKYGIPMDKFCVVVADGAYASARAKSYTDELLKTKKPLTIVVIAGKNEELYRHYAETAASVPANLTLIPMRFCPRAYELYAAADLFITKSGPNAILDSLYMGTPILVDFYAHPIEKASAKLFVDTLGCGAAIYNKRKARKAVEQWIEHPELLNAYRENIAKIDRSQKGSEKIADIIMDTIRSKHIYRLPTVPEPVVEEILVTES